MATPMIGRMTPLTRAEVSSMAGKSFSRIVRCTMPISSATATATAADSVGVKTPE